MGEGDTGHANSFLQINFLSCPYLGGNVYRGGRIPVRYNSLPCHIIEFFHYLDAYLVHCTICIVSNGQGPQKLHASCGDWHVHH